MWYSTSLTILIIIRLQKAFQGLVEFKDVEFHQPDDPHIRLQKPFNGVVEFEDVVFHHCDDNNNNNDVHL